MKDLESDVVVVGAGNAAMCAALSARERGAEVLMIETAPEAESGGNSRYTAGAMRVVFDGVEDLVRVMDLSAREIENTDFGRYTREQYYDDMARVTRFRCDPDMVETLVENSLDTMVWMRSKGVRLPALLRPPGIPDRRALPILGRSGGGDVGRRPRAGRKSQETLRTRRHRDPLRVPRRIPDRRGRRGAGRRRARRRRSVPGTRARRGARMRRLRVECRVAHPVPGPGLGSRAGAGHPIQRGRRDRMALEAGGDVVRELVGVSLRGVGSKRTGVRRSLRGRQLPEAQLSVRDHGERAR